MDRKLAGFNVFVGGGLGMAFGNKQTYPRGKCNIIKAPIANHLKLSYK